jgi:hypothetical protein
MRRTTKAGGILLAIGLLAAWPPARLPAQGIQSATLRRAQQAYDNLEYRQALTLAQASLRERLSGADRARAYELAAFTYSAMDSLMRAVDAFKQVVLLEPERTLDPNRTSTKALSAFQVALTQVLVVRGLRVDSGVFVVGQGALPIRYTVTQPARVVTRLLGGGRTIVVDSAVANGQVNLRWPARLPNGDPLPAGSYTVVVDASVGQNSFAASQAMRVSLGAVDTTPHLTSLPGYEPLPETEVPPKSWRPLGLAFLYAGVVGAGTAAIGSGDLGHTGQGELLAVSAVTLAAGLITTLKKPAPQPARANILYNRLLREQLARRNQEIARDNVARRQQVEIRVTPVARGGR